MNKIIFLNSNLIMCGSVKTQFDYLDYIHQNKYDYEIVIIEDRGEENVFEKYCPKPPLFLKSQEYLNQQLKIREERNQNIFKKIKFNLALKNSYKHILKEFDKIYNEFKPDVIVDFNNCLRGDIDKYNCKTIGWTHTFISNWLSKKSSAKRFAKALNNYSKVVTVSKSAAEDLVNLNPKLEKKIHCIYNPFDFEKIKKLSDEDFFDEKFDFPLYRHTALDAVSPETVKWSYGETPHQVRGDSEKDLANKKFLLMVARLENKSKDFETLFSAFEIAKENGYDGELFLIGDGEHREYVENLKEKSKFKNNIKLLGVKMNPFNWMKKCDKFILSSKFEGLGNVLIEALTVNDTVISSDCKSGPSEILENGKIGYLFEVGNAEQLANLILEAKPKNKNEIENSLQRFSHKNIMQEFEEIIV